MLDGVQGSDFFGVQESHAKHADLLDMYRAFRSTHWIGASSCGSNCVFDNLSNHVVDLEVQGVCTHSQCSGSDHDVSSEAYSWGSGRSSGESSSTSSSSLYENSAISDSDYSSKSSHASISADLSSGGVISFVRRAFFSAAATCSFDMLVPGRCIETHVVDNAKHF